MTRIPNAKAPSPYSPAVSMLGAEEMVDDATSTSWYNHLETGDVDGIHGSVSESLLGWLICDRRGNLKSWNGERGLLTR